MTLAMRKGGAAIAMRPQCDCIQAGIRGVRVAAPQVSAPSSASSGSPAYDLIKRFHWTNQDQDVVAAYIFDQHLSDDAAATKWLDANPATWHAWLP